MYVPSTPRRTEGYTDGKKNVKENTGLCNRVDNFNSQTCKAEIQTALQIQGPLNSGLLESDNALPVK